MCDNYVNVTIGPFIIATTKNILWFNFGSAKQQSGLSENHNSLQNIGWHKDKEHVGLL